MSFVVQLYRNSSRDNQVDKTITKLKDDLEGTLKDNCSIINPVIVMRINDIGSLSDCNYMYIEHFGRYYYVTDIISIRSTIVEIHAHVDVLMSFKSQIRDNNCIIARYNKTSAIGNTYLQDDRMASYQDAMTTSYNFSKKFDRSTENFILVVAGG